MLWDELGQDKRKVTSIHRFWWWVFHRLPRAWVSRIVAGYIADCGAILKDNLAGSEHDAWLRVHILTAMFYRSIYELNRDESAFNTVHTALVSIRALCAAAANTLALWDTDKKWSPLGGAGSDEVH